MNKTKKLTKQTLLIKREHDTYRYLRDKPDKFLSLHGTIFRDENKDYRIICLDNVYFKKLKYHKTTNQLFTKIDTNRLYGN